MRKKVVFAAVIAAFLFCGKSTIVLAQDTTAKTIGEVPSEPEVQWLWGEVVSVDTAKNEMTVKYLDYEADVEKEMVVGVDEKTTYENTKSVAEIKPQDTVSVDYVLGADGKALARNLSVEKPEMAPPLVEGMTQDQPKMGVESPKNPAQNQPQSVGIPEAAPEQPAEAPAAAAGN